MARLTRRTALVGATAFAAVAGPQTRAQDPALGVWRERAAMPIPAQEIYPALWSGRIVVAGGFTVQDGEPAISQRTFHYDLAGDSWSDGPDLPEPRHHPQLTTIGDRLYAIAGFAAEADVGGWVMRASGWVWDEETERWADAPALPAPRGEAVLLEHEGRLHLIGGRSPIGEANAEWTDHGDVADHVVLDPAVGRWEPAAPAPTARNSATGAVLGGLLYVVGGRRVNDGSNTELEVYDPAADRWDSLAPMPQGQGGLAGGVLGGRLVAFGGEYFDGPDGGGVHPECWMYDPTRDAWEPGPDMRTPRHGLGGVTVGEAIYAVGGATGVAADGTSAVTEMLEAG